MVSTESIKIKWITSDPILTGHECCRIIKKELLMTWGYYILIYWIAGDVIFIICILLLANDNWIKTGFKSMERYQLWITVSFLLLFVPLLIIYYLVKEVVLFICSLPRMIMGLIYVLICPKLARKRKEITNLYISIARNFEHKLSDIAYRNINADEVLTILKCVALDDNCHIGYRPADYNNGESGDNANLYLYEGDDWQNGRQSRHSERCIYRLLLPEIKSCQNTVFEHLSIEKSELGAWQAYLLSVSSTMLPAEWHGLYYTRFFVFSKEDIKKIKPNGSRAILWLWADVTPKVWIKNDTAYVSCCYWNDWDGLIRETMALKYEGDHINRIEMVKEKKLYRYSNPVIL